MKRLWTKNDISISAFKKSSLYRLSTGFLSCLRRLYFIKIVFWKKPGRRILMWSHLKIKACQSSVFSCDFAYCNPPWFLIFYNPLRFFHFSFESNVILSITIHRDFWFLQSTAISHLILESTAIFSLLLQSTAIFIQSIESCPWFFYL